MSDSTPAGSYALGLLSIMIAQQALSYFLERIHFPYLQESGLQIIVGGVAGYITHLLASYHLTFSKDLFFYVLIPTYFFSAAYGMEHKYFSKYFFYINWFGILGTLLNIFIIFGFTFAINTLGWIQLDDKIIKLSNYEMIAFALIISSLEGVVGRATVNHHYRPKLHSVLFGEEMINDLTIYSLFISLLDMDWDGKGLVGDWVSYFKLFGLAMGQFFGSILFGIFMGAMMTLFSRLLFLMFKSEVAVTSFVIYTGYFVHSLAKIFHLAGGVSIFFVGIIYSHYLKYNMPHRCFKFSKVSIQVIASIFETFIFVYLGLTACQIFLDNYQVKRQISWQFIFAQLFAVFTTRVISYSAMVGLLFITQLRNPKTMTLYKYDMIIICLSGFVKGTISFALIQYMNKQDNGDNQDEIITILVIQSTVLFIIIISNLLISIIMVFVAQACYRQMKQLGVDEKKNMKLAELKGQQKRSSSVGMFINSWGTKIRLFSMHLNEHYIKPLLIYNFKGRQQEIKNYSIDAIKSPPGQQQQTIIVPQNPRHHSSQQTNDPVSQSVQIGDDQNRKQLIWEKKCMNTNSKSSKTIYEYKFDLIRC